MKWTRDGRAYCVDRASWDEVNDIVGPAETDADNGGCLRHWEVAVSGRSGQGVDDVVHHLSSARSSCAKSGCSGATAAEARMRI